ncbi:MAG: TetR/AcrR family transcriptional regulator [Meiothermus sp.]
MTETRSAREQILETAARLFYQYGYRAVGVDTIIAESGVAKMTLYRHFPAKDDLIVAYLERSGAAFWNWLETLIKDEPDARKQLELIYEAVANRAVNAACLGCTFMAAALEFPEFDHRAHAVALEYKKSVLARLTELSRQAGAKNPEALGGGLMLLMDGAWSAARMFGPGSHADKVSDAAKTLIAAAIDQTPTRPR